MRFIPWIIVFSLILPFAIWYIIDQYVLGGAATKITTEDSYSWMFFIPFFGLIFIVMGAWMSKAIKQSKG